MAKYSTREIFYVLILISAVWFLILFMQLEQCSNGLNSSSRDTQAIALHKALNSKEKEIHYLREKLKYQDPKTHREGLPVIYIITPTYSRPVQKAELSRLSHTFRLLPNIHWIIVEDSERKTPLVTNFLHSTGLNFTQLTVTTPPEIKLKETDPNWLKPRGVLQRNTGLTWLRANLNPDKNAGVVYFADDDNTYSTQLFDEMRDTQIVSVWPVGLVGKLKYESPILKHGKVVDWHTYWYRGQREFAMDMSGFAINLKLILENKDSKFDIMSQRGYQESNFLKSVGVTLNQLEPKADMCTKILVWHTRTEVVNLSNEEKMLAKGYEKSDIGIEI